MTNAFTPKQVEYLHKRGLTEQDATDNGVIAILSEADLPEGTPDYWRTDNGYLPALGFPKVSPDGNETWQLAPDDPPLDHNGRPKKYVGVKDATVKLNTHRHNVDYTKSLIIEGTAQGIVAAIHTPEGYNVFSIDGCENFSTDKRLSEDFRVIAGTEVTVCLDADAGSNLMVYTAGERLADAVLTYGGLSPRFIRIPGGGTTGLDDHLVKYPRDLRTRQIEFLIEDARTRKGQSADKPAGRKPDPGRGEDTDDADSLRTAVLDTFTLARDESGEVLARRRQGTQRTAVSLERALMESATALYSDDGDQSIIPRNVIKDVGTHIEGRTDLPRVRAAVRVCHRPDSLVIDIGDESGDVITVTGEGWSVGPNTDDALWFLRPSAQLPLPRPESGGSVDELRAMFPVDDEQWRLILGWIIASPFAGFERPWLHISGPRGSGKTGTARQALMFDPVVDLMSMSKDRADPTVAAINRYIPAYDNASELTKSDSDWISTLVTGMTASRRTLWTTAGETTFRIMRTGILTGISISGIRPDMAERLIDIPLVRDSGKQRARTDLESDNAHDGARFLGAVLDAVSLAMKGIALGVRHTGTWTRFHDYAAVLAGYDHHAGTDLAETYAGLSERDRESASLSDPTVMALLDIVNGKYDGDTGEIPSATLRDDLEQEVGPFGSTFVPVNAKAMTTFLANNWAEPIDGIRFSAGRRKKFRWIRLHRPDAAPKGDAGDAESGGSICAVENSYLVVNEKEGEFSIETCETSKSASPASPSPVEGHPCAMCRGSTPDGVKYCRACADSYGIPDSVNRW